MEREGEKVEFGKGNGEKNENRSFEKGNGYRKGVSGRKNLGRRGRKGGRKERRERGSVRPEGMTRECFQESSVAAWTFF